MVKIQEVLLKDSILDNARGLYYSGDSPLEISESGSVKLHKGKYYDFFTFFNSLPVKFLSEHLCADNFQLVLEAKGDFKVELFGYAGVECAYQKEWISVQSVMSSAKKKIVIPITSVFSEAVSFGIFCNDDSFIYNAYYEADADKKGMSAPVIQVLSASSDDEYVSVKKMKFMTGDLLSDTFYKDKFIFDEIPEGSDNVSDITAGVLDRSATHVLYVGDNYISSASLKRLYLFLSMLKKEYRDFCISGAITDIKNTDIMIGISKNVAESLEDVRDSFVQKDLSGVSGVVDVEGSEPLNAIEASGLACVPVSVIKKKNASDVQTIRMKGLNAFGKDVKKRFLERNGKLLSESFYKLQNLLFDAEKSVEITKYMYYRSPASVEKYDSESVLFQGNSLYDFFTYFNAFSLEKWKKYTHINNLYLVLEVRGCFDIELFGHYKNKTGYQKELCGKYHYDCGIREKVFISFPKGMMSSLVGFAINAHTDLIVYDGYYATDLSEVVPKEPLISMVTTTFKKEEYVHKNIELLSHNLLNDDEYKDHFIWNIIDNGKTLTLPSGISDSIRLFPNRNVGGAGGFAKGMIVSLKQKEKPDYILLMDDDVVFVPESFKRLYTLLSILKDEYKDYFISGAMLKMGQPNVQHEDIGKLITDGYHMAVKPNYDLNLWNHIIDNEVINESADHMYGAWWFCCIPTTVANLDNLPVPVFVRGDDVEYSLRNNAKFITMNGLCIWHEGFEGKFSAALEYYQVNRNELAVRAMHPELSDVDCIGHIKIVFWEELYKFNYKGASLLLDSVEDYMKGPDFFKTLDGEKSMKKKREKDYKMKPLTPEIRAMADLDSLYDYVPVPGKLKKIYDYTYNGQARIPDIVLKKKTGVIPYGWGYFPGKMCLTDRNIAIDKTNETYTVFRKNRRKFNALKKRFECLMDKYNKEHKRIERDYRDAFKELTGEEFWEEYLSR